MHRDTPRAKIIGDDSGPQPPFPLRMKGIVVSGFGRGSKELGIPTANIPVDTAPWIEKADSGIYFGWAGIRLPPNHPAYPSHSSTSPTTHPQTPQTTLPDSAIAAGWVLYPMVMSIGYNPFYKNTVRSAEVHVLHEFTQDFYGAQMCLRIEGYVRPELDYVSVEALVEDIREDCEVAKRSLGREAWRRGLGDSYLWGEDKESEA